MTAVIGFVLTFTLKPLAFVVAAVVALMAVVYAACAAYYVARSAYRTLARHYERLNYGSKALAVGWHGRHLEYKLGSITSPDTTATKALRSAGVALLAVATAAVLVPSYMLSDTIWKAIQEDQYLLIIAPALIGSALLVVARPALHFGWMLVTLDTEEWAFCTIEDRELNRFRSENPKASRDDWYLFQSRLRDRLERLRNTVAEVHYIEFRNSLNP